MASPTCLLRNDKPLVVKHSQRQMRTFTPKRAMYKYTEQATIQ
jgi:hypothetical protein